MNTQLARYAGWAAFVTGIMSIIGFVSLALFFALEAPGVSANPDRFHFWGFVSDVSSPATMLPLLIVILALHEIERDRARILSQMAKIIGVIGALAVTVLQVLLIIKVLSFEQEVGPVVFATALVGVWLVLANHLGRVQQILPTRLAWLGIAVGASQVLYPVILQALGGARFYENIGSDYMVLAVTGLVFLVSYLGFPVWAIALGRRWPGKRIKARGEAVYAG